MSSVGSAELIFILIIGLIVLGPKRLPEIANKVGGWVGQARRMTRVMKRQLEEELNSEEFKSIGRQLNEAPPKPAAAPNPADPAYDYSGHDEEPVAEHIPNDDDTYSPLHEDDKPA